jgi:hypothetical protein
MKRACQMAMGPWVLSSTSSSRSGAGAAVNRFNPNLRHRRPARARPSRVVAPQYDDAKS